MSGRAIWIIYRKEMVDSLRDRRTVISMIVVPILLMPLLTAGTGTISAIFFRKAMQETPTVMLIGGEDSPRLAGALRAFQGVRLVPFAPNYLQLITNKELRAAAEIPAGFDAALDRGEPARIRIYMYQGELRSGFAASRLRNFLAEYQERVVRERLAARSLPAELIHPFQVDEKNVAPSEKVSGTVAGGLIPYFVIILCLIGGMYPAMDLTAGEKERGTMETILCSPVSRADLVFGKFLTVLTASGTSALLTILSMAGTLRGVRGLIHSLAQYGMPSLPLQLSGAAMGAVFVMVLPLAVLFSAALLAISLFARNYKEAQSYLSPLTIVVAAPAIVSVLPGIELNTPLSLVPVLNISLASKEIMAGTYHWGHIALIFGSSCVYASLALVIAMRLFEREEALFRR